MQGRLESDLTFGAILGHLSIWAVLIVLTAGIALMFYPYSMANFVLSHCKIVVDGRSARVVPRLSIVGRLLHILGWTVIVVLTFGLGWFFYVFKVWKVAIESCEIA